MEMFLRTSDLGIGTFESGVAKLAPEYAEHLNNNAFTQGGPILAQNMLAGFLSVIGALHRAGVPIVAGTDVVVPAQRTS